MTGWWLKYIKIHVDVQLRLKTYRNHQPNNQQHMFASKYAQGDIAEWYAIEETWCAEHTENMRKLTWQCYHSSESWELALGHTVPPPCNQPWKLLFVGNFRVNHPKDWNETNVLWKQKWVTLQCCHPKNHLKISLVCPWLHPLFFICWSEPEPHEKKRWAARLWSEWVEPGVRKWLVETGRFWP
jgi:hypothetical protein